MWIPLLLALLTNPLARAGAPASDGTAAEARRLRTEMASLVARNVWTGADRAYVAMVALGVPMSSDDHWNGALASRALGNPNDTLARLKAAEAAGPTAEIYDELAMLYAAYGGIEITVSKKHVMPSLTALDMPFDPVMRRTIDACRAALNADHAYVGLLPHGRYDLSGTKFEIVGEALVKVKVR